uniref:C-type lectin domain family 4 member C-like n=1 Tax=Scleropages formosus TaxID=113540 RepID=A0A8C9U8M0_SCLFO
MSDELFYSSVILPKPCDLAVEVKKNEEVVYAEVRKTELPPLETALDPAGQQSVSSAGSPEKSEPRVQPNKKVVVSSVVLCALLVEGIIALCVCYIQLRNSNATNQEIQTLNKNLTAEKENLEREIRELKIQGDEYRMERDSLNQTLMTILQFDNFPVTSYCEVSNSRTKERQCSPCQMGWKLYNSSCYYVYLSSPWKTWSDSRQECIKMGADLVTIDSEDEQRFISELAPSYFDQWHGYWIGLCKITRGWFWVNGAPLTEEFWINEPNNDENRCALTNTKDNTLKSWRSAYSWQMRNRWICENKALIF